jgi:hypothetical protein
MKTNRNPHCRSRFYAALVACLAVTIPAQAGPSRERPPLEKVTGQSTREMPVPVGHKAFQPMVLLSPDGFHYVQTTSEGRINYCRTRDGCVQRRFFGCSPSALAFSSDSSLLAYAGSGGGCGQAEEITIKVWKVKVREPEARLTLPGTLAEAIAVTSNRVVVAGDSHIHCFSVSEGELAWRIAKQAGIRELKFSEDGLDVVVNFENGKVAAYNAETGLERRCFPPPEIMIRMIPPAGCNFSLIPSDEAGGE